MRIHRLAFAALLASLVVSAPCLAEAWVAKMFQEQEHDFGTVARGADAVYRFEAKNIYKQDVTLLSVRSSCGCTSPTLENKLLKTGDAGYVVATFNTRTFSGDHGATLTVNVEWNDNGVRRRGETQLRVHGNIRSDLVFQPGAIRFDNVDQGVKSEQTVRLTYAGRSNWKILDVRGVSEAFEVELTETQRFSGRVAYDLLVRLKDSAPAGYFNDQLILVTNDQQSPRVPVDVAGRVVPEISVAPESLMLGEVQHGRQVSKKVIVRGKKPFRISSVECDAGCLQVKTDEGAKDRHVVEIVFDAKQDPGTVKELIHIETDLGENYHATLTAYATVVPEKQSSDATQPEASASRESDGAVTASIPADQLVSQ